MDEPATCAVPFRPHSGGVVTRTQNASEYMLVLALCLVTLCVSRRRRKMYCGHARLCVCLCVCVSVCLSAAVRPHYCTDPDVTRLPPSCALLADLQSGHGFLCYDNITPKQNVSECLYSLYAWICFFGSVRQTKLAIRHNIT